ncbi:cobalamin biosynthesis protein CobQ [Candidatus Gottesmanbacteria bacterium]|nr:cobalamin biosynthesis protein CobQ [Candidatus Gottesmanbacteria bacterium]
MKKILELTVGWLYPDLMSTYGDRGNVIVLSKRSEWRSIPLSVIPISFETSRKDLLSCNLVLGGGAQDREQELVANDLRLNKGKTLKEMFTRGIPGLFVCGSPQLLGKYYMTGDGKKLLGLGIFQFVTKHFGHDKPRCIGNTAGKVVGIPLSEIGKRETIVGFENHGGRTYLGQNDKPFAQVLKGYGNNGEDGYEGAVYKNVIACYYHGPFLSKNPHIADWLLTKALEIKYGKIQTLTPLNDRLEWKAHMLMLSRLEAYKDI